MGAGPVSRIPWTRFGAEALIIIASILLALGVDEWRQERNDRILEREYLLRLVQDMDENLRAAEIQVQLDIRKIAFARRLYPLVAHGEWGDLTPEEAVIDAYLASPSDTPIWVDDTFEELKSTGRLELISNPDIRSGVLAYYRALEYGGWSYKLMSTEYRDAVRSRMNPELQLEIRRVCGMDRWEVLVEDPGLDVIVESFQVRDECSVGITGYDHQEFIGWLENNRELADGLTRVILQWSRGAYNFLPRVQSETNDLKQLIQAELDN